MHSILIADDHEIVRRGLRELIEGQEGFTVAGEAKTGEETLELAKRLRPEVLLLDLSLPDLHGLEVASRLREHALVNSIFMLSMYSDQGYVREARKIGVQGYILKQDPVSEVLLAVKERGTHTFFLSRGLRRMVENAEIVTENEWGITEREMEVLRLLSLGDSNQMVGEKLGISHKTVDVHRTHIMKKLEVHNTAELISKAFRCKLIS